jgi:SAM-dependent methyltransferase
LSHGDGSDAEYAYDSLFAAESRHFWFRARNSLILWALGRYFPGAVCFLEIGCGTGFVLSGVREAFPELALSASDVRAEGLVHAASRLPGVSLFQMDARRIPFEAEFDVVGAFDVLEHIAEDESVLTAMARATKPDGGILLTVPQHRLLWSVVDDFSRHKRRYTRLELTEKVRRAGFEVVRVTSFCALLLPFLILARLRQPRNLPDFDPMGEFRIGRALNASLEAVLHLERLLVRRGLSFPVGGSLLLVARKRATSPLVPLYASALENERA